MNNLLNIALSVLPKTKARWYQFDRLDADDRGREIAVYKEPIEIIGSFQAMDIKTIQEMGLDTNKDYKVFYTSNNIKQVQRATSPDYLENLEDKYDILDNNNWFKINGWNGFLCIKQI
ncbi:phage collar protein [Aliarcobacter lanthieri]|uniref:phage collar protein n=1 Tax=Aliarcobacter lanthieri TaxID=1355374 RepID=UPI003AA87DFE